MLMRTPLYEKHCALGAKMVPFCGWEMPLQYAGMQIEHVACRSHAGLFDVSHMGRIAVLGPDAEVFLDFLSTAKIAEKPDKSCTYTAWAQEDGKGTVDDLIVYRKDNQHFFVVVNASNREKDLQHMRHYAKDYDVAIEPRFAHEGILALQGPKAKEVATALFEQLEALRFFRFEEIVFEGHRLYASRTGYTGEFGYEFMAPNEVLESLWQALLDLGKGEVHPIGLGARNTLRLEMGFALYGHELTDTLPPHESIASWAVHWDKTNFLGKESMLASKGQACAAAIEMEGERSIPRDGYAVLRDGQVIGQVTSGGYSPSLKKGIALVHLQEKVEKGQPLAVEIRGQAHPAHVVSLPFYQKKKVKG